MLEYCYFAENSFISSYAKFKFLRFTHVAVVDNIVYLPTQTFREKLPTQGRKKLASLKNDFYSNNIVIV